MSKGIRLGGRQKGQNLTYQNRMTIGEADELKATMDSADVARYLGISRAQVQKMANAGELPGRKVGSVWRFSTRVIMALLEVA